MPFFSDKRHNTMSKAPDSKQILALKETDAALSAHRLIKVRVAGGDRAERVQIAAALCEAADAHLVQHIGKLLVLWREKQDEE